MNGDRHVLV